MKIHIQSNAFNGELEFQTATELVSLPQYEKWWPRGLRLCGTTLQDLPDFSQYVDGGQTLGEYLEGQASVSPSSARTGASKVFLWPAPRRRRRNGCKTRFGL